MNFKIENATSDTIDILNPFDEIRLIPSGSIDNDCNDNNLDKNRKKKTKKIFCSVYRIYGSKICFKLRDRDAKPINLDKQYDVSFRPGRIPIRYQYRALEILNKKDDLKKFLFPTINFNKTLPNIR